jgi:hypothetical protein
MDGRPEMVGKFGSTVASDSSPIITNIRSTEPIWINSRKEYSHFIARISAVTKNIQDLNPLTETSYSRFIIYTTA